MEKCAKTTTQEIMDVCICPGGLLSEKQKPEFPCLDSHPPPEKLQK